MFQGAIRHDINGAEILALKAADCREGHLKDLLAEEEFDKQKGAAEDKGLNYIDKDIMKDDKNETNDGRLFGNARKYQRAQVLTTMAIFSLERVLNCIYIFEIRHLPFFFDTKCRLLLKTRIEKG